MFHILQISTGYSDGSIEREIIEKAGGTLTLSGGTAPDAIVAAGADADGLLVTLTQVPAQVIFGMPKLKLIVRAGIGVDNIDLEAAKEKGVRVCNLPHYCQEEVADHTVALLLAIERKLVAQANDMAAGQWKPASAYAPVFGLQGKSVGFVGFGGIARKVAARLRSFGLRCLVYDPYLPEAIKEKEEAEYTGLDEVLQRADYLSLHLPATAETHHMISAEALAKMKPTAYLINTARGQLVDNDALLAALDQHRLAGAALDVVDGEGKGAVLLAGRDDVILTPHTAYYSVQSSHNMKVESAKLFAEWIEGRPLRNVVV